MGLIKAQLDKQKLRGGYYTPAKIAEFLCRWAITGDEREVLEPSSGDGNFVEAIARRFQQLGVEGKDINKRLHAVELIEEEVQKVKSRVGKLGVPGDNIVNEDFFQYINDRPEKQFDVVLGNPPFIRYQSFPEEHRAIAIELMEQLGLHPNKLTNIWVPFLVISASRLRENGRLGMVIPAELFQVKYAAETRVFLSEFFQRVTIVTFRRLVFEDIQQEVVLLLCEKNVENNSGIRVVELESSEDLAKMDMEVIMQTPVKELDHDSEKWTKYFLTEEEIRLLRRIKNDPRIRPAGIYLDVNVGLVTGRNDFFMLNDEVARKWNVLPFTRKVVSRSNHFKGIIFSDADFQANIEAGVDGYLFLPPDEDFSLLPQACQAYIKHGQEEEYHTGYKCRIRKRWYITPSLYDPGGFALRQVADYPKLIVNASDTSSTDTIHRVRLRDGGGVPFPVLALSFLNSLSFAFSEITGRSYGGGVLTFEPTEIEEIPLPVLEDLALDFSMIDRLVREKRIEEVLDLVDQELLIDQLHFTREEVEKLRGIWRKLSDRRQNRR